MQEVQLSKWEDVSEVETLAKKMMNFNARGMHEQCMVSAPSGLPRGEQGRRAIPA